MFEAIEKKVREGRSLPRRLALSLRDISGGDLLELFAVAHRVMRQFRGDRADLCAIMNAKSGACPEDCSYCAQSARSSAETATFPLARAEDILARAETALAEGARRFCIVTSGRKVTQQELGTIAGAVRGIRDMGLLPCATLGLLSADELRMLKDSGLERYHHNLEASERFFPLICTTHTYTDKLRTIDAVREAGLSLCCGGIFGLGEEWEDRVDMAYALEKIGPDSVPINFLIPIPGTKLGTRKPLDPMEALKTISLFRLVLPSKEVRVCGGRLQTLGELNSLVFFAGADGLLIGNYLTTPGRKTEDDLRLAEQCGLAYR